MTNRGLVGGGWTSWQDCRTCSALSYSGQGCPSVPSRVPTFPGSLIPCPRELFLSRCYTKITELGLKSRNLKKFHLIVNNEVNRFSMTRSQKTRGEKMKDSLAMLLKTNGGKMSVLASLAMLLKKQLVTHRLSRCL